MADGTLCPHAKGEPVPGEAPPSDAPLRSASTAPIAAAGRSAAPAPAPRPASPPAGKTQAQRPAQTGAQQGAGSAAQTAPARAVSTVRSGAVASAPRQIARAEPSRPEQPRATRAVDRSSRRSIARPASGARREGAPASVRGFVPPVTPEVADVATRAVVRDDAVGSSERTVPAVLVVVLGLGALGVLAALIARYRRRGSGGAVPVAQPAAPTMPQAVADPVEAELQDIIDAVAAREDPAAGEAEPAGHAPQLTGSR